MADLRSIEKEKERTKALLARLQQRPELANKLVESVPAILEQVSSIWINNQEPMAFDIYFNLLDGQYLFDGPQTNAFDIPDIWRATRLFSSERIVTEWVLVFGKGCLDGLTNLTDRKTGITRTLREWSQRNESLILLTTDGERVYEVETDGPVSRIGTGPMLTVTLSDGRSCRVTYDHKFYTPDGKIEAKNLTPGVSRVRALSVDDGESHYHQVHTSSLSELSRIEPSPMLLPPKSLAHYALVLSVTPCGEADYYTPHVPGTGCYFDDNGLLQSNSGKDYISAKFTSWVTYCLLHLKNPQQFLGRPNNEPIDVINVAPTEKLAKRVFFRRLKNYITHPLFAPFITSPRHQILSDAVIFPDKMIGLWSLHSNSAGIDGFSPIVWVADELDAMENAQQVHDILRSSATTRYGQRWVGIDISYPRTEEGTILALYEKGKNDPTYYVDLAPTAKVNLKFDANSPSVLSDYKNDPETAMALYECIPKPVVAGFFKATDKIDQAMDTSLVPVAEIECKIEHGEKEGDPLFDEKGEAIMFVVPRVSLITPEPGRLYFLGGDGGTSGDSYALSIMSIDNSEDSVAWLCPLCGGEPEVRCGMPYIQLGHNAQGFGDPGSIYCGGCAMNVWEISGTLKGWWHLPARQGIEVVKGNKSLTLPYLREELVLEIEPTKRIRNEGFNAQVSHNAVNAVCDALFSQLPITAGGFDPTQTMQTIQALKLKGYNVDAMSQSNPEQYRRATLFKAILYQNGMRLFPHAKGKRELRRLRDINGTKVDHPPNKDGQNESKDIYDARSMACWKACLHFCSGLETSWLGG